SDGMSRAFGSELLGPDGSIWTPSVEGDTIALTFGAGDRFQVAEMAHLFASPAPLSTSCYADVACNSFPDLDTLSQSIGAMLYVSGSGLFVCTGGLINSTVNDRLFLTANHCISTQA